MTKEEKQAQIHIFETLIIQFSNFKIKDPLTHFKNLLKIQKRFIANSSIQDLQREAFEAGRKILGSEYESELATKTLIGVRWEYPDKLKFETFENYLKTLNNG